MQDLPRKCHWSEHKNRPYLIEYKTETETRTVEDLKKKYHRAVKEKATSEKMMKSIEESLQKVHEEVLTMIKKAQQSLRRLDEIALKPNPLTQVDYLEILIESEKAEAKSGWKQRVKYLEVAKSHAETLSKVKDEKESQNLIKTLSRDAKRKRQGMKWRNYPSVETNGTVASSFGNQFRPDKYGNQEFEKVLLL